MGQHFFALKLTRRLAHLPSFRELLSEAAVPYSWINSGFDLIWIQSA